MDDIGSKFLETQSLQSGLDILIMCSLFGLMGKKKFQLFLTDLNNYNPHIKSTYEFNKEHMSFLD